MLSGGQTGPREQNRKEQKTNMFVEITSFHKRLVAERAFKRFETIMSMLFKINRNRSDQLSRREKEEKKQGRTFSCGSSRTLSVRTLYRIPGDRKQKVLSKHNNPSVQLSFCWKKNE